MAKRNLKIDGLLQIDERLKNLTDDYEFMKDIHSLFAYYCDPYVPYDSGTLATVEVTDKCVKYNTVYARYQYYGKVYGPNFLVYKDGQLLGWRSPAGQKKSPTGRMIGEERDPIIDKYGNVITFGYNKSEHPLATHHWDKRMMEDVGSNFLSNVRRKTGYYINQGKVWKWTKTPH